MSVQLPTKQQRQAAPGQPAPGGRPVRGDGAAAAGRSRRQPAVRTWDRRDGRSLPFNWGSTLTRAEMEQVQSRLAFLGLAGVVVLVVVLVAGALLWDRVIVAGRPVLRVDGYQMNLQEYANTLSYRRNVLESELAQAMQLASAPAQPGADASQTMLAQFAQQQVRQIQGTLASLNTQLVEDVIQEQLIREEAKKRNIVVTEEAFQKELKQVIGYRDPAAEPATSGTSGSAAGEAASPAATPANSRARRAGSFEDYYRNYRRFTGGTDQVIRADVEMRILRRELGQQLGEAVPATAEQVRARHILVADEALARTVVQRLRDGEDFAALAAEFSTDPGSKDNGGDLGWYARGALVKPFEDAAFSQPVGQIGEPVQTTFGWHIIQVLERDPARSLEGQALAQAKDQALPKWIEQEEKNHKIERLLTDDMIDWAQQHARKPARAAR